MRVLICTCIFVLSLFGQRLDISDFEADVYSKISKEGFKKINLTMIIDGRGVVDESYKVVDALNVVIGSFFVQDLLTSKGKERLKETFIEYASKKYGIDIDEVYILRLSLKEFPLVEEIVEALKREGCCSN